MILTPPTTKPPKNETKSLILNKGLELDESN